jgi:hypothetical protein
MATKPLPIPSAATPDSPNAGAIPLSQYLDPSDIAPPYLSLPAASGPGHAPIPPALLPPEPTAAPQDPNAGAIPLDMPQPNAGAIDLSVVPGIYTPEQIKNTDVATLVADKNFRPVDWLADNEKNSLADPKVMEKVQDVYTEKLKSDKGALHDLVTLPLHPIKAAKSSFEVAKALASSVAEIPAVVGRAAGRASTGDFTGAAGEVAAAAQAVSASERRDVNLLLKTLRGIKEKTPLVGAGPETPEDYKKRLFFDLEMKKQENEARAGNGELSKVLGVDSESLKDHGITVNPDAVEKLSVIEDPINFIPVGGAVGAVGRFGKMVVASALTAEKAEQLAFVLNNAARVAATKGVQAAGTIVEQLGKLEGPGAALRRAPLGGSLGTAVKGVGLATELAAKPFRIVGKGIRESAPVTGNIVAEGLKGAAEAAAITFPLTIGATPEEREALLGNIGLAAGLRAGGTAVGLGTRAAANWTRDKAAAELYKNVERAAPKESPSYGTDPDLDVAHEKQMADTGSATKNVINYFREFFRDSGIEIYGMDKNDFVKNVDPVGGAEKAKGYYVKRGVRVNPDGSQSPVNQIFLNGSADALSHELFHAFEDLDPHGAAQLKTSIASEWTPQESKEWKQTYESALNGGKPEKDWTHRLSDNDLRSEAAAEVFGRVLDATDLTGVAPTIQQKAARFAAGVLEKLGYPLGGINKAPAPGVSELGVRASTKQFDAAKNFISNLTSRVKETGSAIGEKQPAVPLNEFVPGEISRKPAPPSTPPPAAPVAPAPPSTPPPAAPPAAAPAPTIPIEVKPAAPTKGGQLELGLPTTARNIRVPAQKQLDFAAKRAQVTNEAEAQAAAERTGTPEVQKVVGDINAGIDAGQTAFEIEHKGVKSESTPEKPLARTPRRTEQEEAYVAESQGALPEDIRTSHQKVSSFVRWDFLKDGTPQFIGYSLDKAIANIEHLMRWSNEKGVAIPYSADAWPQVVQDLKDYYNNQANGYRGDGQKLVRPTEDIQVSLPPENPTYSPVQLSTDKVQFLNAAQGLPAPLTVREVKGKIPGNVKAQLVNELQGGKPEPITAADIKRKEFKTPVGGRKFVISEVNPLRAAMEKAGVPVRELIEVTERLNADDIVSATPRPDLGEVKPGVTDVIRGGFLPSTAKGRELYDKGFDFDVTGQLSNRGVVVRKDGEVVGEISSTRNGTEAKVASSTIAKNFRGQGVGEAAYRELLNQLKQDGVTDFTGMVVAPQPLAIREKIFGKGKTDINGIFGPVEAPEAISSFKEGPNGAIPIDFFDVRNKITPESRFLPEKHAPSPSPSDEVRNVASDYATKRGISYTPAQDYAPLSPKLAKRVADVYDAAKHEPNDPKVQAAYDALKKETVDQYKAIVDAGYTIEPYEGKGEPYANSAAMLKDVRDNKHLYFLRTDEAFTPESGRNLMMEPSGVQLGGKDAPVNDVFRAVHDFFGHVKEGYTFGPRGEYNAWRAHDELYSPEAQPALAAETLGQNAWVNYGKHLRGETGEVPAKGEAGFKPLTERPFAPQKNTIIPEDVLDAARQGGDVNQSLEGAFSPAKRKEKAEKGLSGWILPNQEFKAVGGIHGDNHEDYLGANSEDLNKRFGTAFGDKVGADERINALNKGFTRMRAYNGNVNAEVGQKFWNAKNKDAILSRVLDNIDDVNQFRVTVVGEDGKPLDSHSENLFMADDPAEAAQKVIDSVRSSGGGKFLPAAGTPEYNDYVKERIRESKKFPEALPLEFRRDEDGNYKAGFNGEPLMVAQDYDFMGTPLAKESKGKNAAEKEENYTSTLAKKLQKEYAVAKKNPSIAAGETWYSVCREKLRNLLGDDTKFFAELLGATSAQNNVETNFNSAVEAYNQFKRGAFDGLIEKYREGKKAFANGELADFEKETGKTGAKATYEAFMHWWVEKNELIPTKSSGKRFEMNSRAVMRVLDGSWLQQVKGPKTPNFTGNLTGSTFEATIDVWAARLLHRLSNEGQKRWRIQSANETGVTDADFFIGQKAFRKAADALGIKPDALQAILWFAEKDRWEKNGWTKGIGSAKSDYNTLLEKHEKTDNGRLRKVDNQLGLGNLLK